MFEFQITGEHAQQLDLYNRNELSESVKAGERLLEHLRKQKKEVFPSERNEFLVPIIRFFDDNPFLTQKTPPHIIAEMVPCRWQTSARQTRRTGIFLNTN
ncbi:hypothetical protein NXV02_16735 [Bacteroides ovatus]|nr:hypothetical protein [Bacteroides ovatus]